jgi:hypothetical protein
MQAFQNINRFLAETAAKLPVNAENGLPYIQIATVDEMADCRSDADAPPDIGAGEKAQCDLAGV